MTGADVVRIERQPRHLVSGTVVVGPSCAGPQREGVDCQTPLTDMALRLISADGHVVATTRTGADGHFRVYVPAGTYELQLQTPYKFMRCPRTSLVVEPGVAVPPMRIECDNGMR